MSSNVKAIAIYRQLAASGVAEAQVLMTATALLSTVESDAATQAWPDEIPQRVLGGRSTIELSHDDIMRGARDP